LIFIIENNNNNNNKMEHQDWEQFIIHCKGSDKKNLNNKENNQKEKKNTGVNEFLKDNKLEKKIEDGILKHDKVDKELCKKIQQARLSMGLTQKDLAKKISLQSSVINDIECGKAKYNAQQIVKIKRILKIK